MSIDGVSSIIRIAIDARDPPREGPVSSLGPKSERKTACLRTDFDENGLPADQFEEDGLPAYQFDKRTACLPKIRNSIWDLLGPWLCGERKITTARGPEKSVVLIYPYCRALTIMVR